MGSAGLRGLDSLFFESRMQQPQGLENLSEETYYRVVQRTVRGLTRLRQKGMHWRVCVLISKGCQQCGGERVTQERRILAQFLRYWVFRTCCNIHRHPQYGSRSQCKIRPCYGGETTR